MREGPNRDLDYYRCGRCGLWNYDLDCGMELTDKAARDIAEDQGIDVIVGDFLNYDNPDNDVYDVVVLRHVLEHLPDREC